MSNIRVNINVPKNVKIDSQINDMKGTVEQTNAQIDSSSSSNQTKVQTETINTESFTETVEEYQKTSSTTDQQQAVENENLENPMKQYENNKVEQRANSGNGEKIAGGSSFNQDGGTLGNRGNMGTKVATSTFNTMSTNENVFKNKEITLETSITDSTKENRESIAHDINTYTEIEDVDKLYQVDEYLSKSIELYDQELEQQINSYQELIAHIEEQIKKYEELGYSDGGFSFEEYYENYYNKNLEELDRQLMEKALKYQEYCSKEKLQELGVTQEELSRISVPEIIELCKKKDSEYLKSLEDIDALKVLFDQEVKAKTGLESYEEYVTTLESLQTDLANCNAALYQTQQLRKVAKYKLLAAELEDKEIEAGKFFK